MTAAPAPRSATASASHPAPPSASRAQVVTSWASVGIAVCALFLSVYSAYQTRRTTRLAAMPFIIIEFYWNDSGAGWYFANSGEGLALIKSFKVSVDGRRIRSWNELVETLHLEQKWVFTVPEPGGAMQPNNTGHPAVKIFWLSPPAEKLISMSNRVRIDTCYCSIYGECWTANWHFYKQDMSPEGVASCEVIPDAEKFGTAVPH